MSTEQELHAAVVGAGAMGQHHARVYAEMKDVRLIGVCDTFFPRATSVATQHGGQPYADLSEMLKGCPDVISVAVPASAHCMVTEQCLMAGAHVLVEKPIAVTVYEAESMIRLTEEQDRVLMVGHIERFNPAMQRIRQLLEGRRIGTVHRVTALRCGQSPHSLRDKLDIGITIDLAIHDIDLMLWLFGPGDVIASIVRHSAHGVFDDGVVGLLCFDSGIDGIVQADWLSNWKARTWTIVGDRGAIEADLIMRKVTLYRDSHGPEQTEFFLPYVEPLKTEIAAFVEAVRGRGPVPVTGQEGLWALRVALTMLRGA